MQDQKHDTELDIIFREMRAASDQLAAEAKERRAAREENEEDSHRRGKKRKQ